MVAHKWARWLHNPYRLSGPQRFKAGLDLEVAHKLAGWLHNPCRLSGPDRFRRGYVATRPTCGPILIVRPALKRWGPPRRQGLCSPPDQLLATSDSAPCSKAARRQGLCSHLAHLWATFDFLPLFSFLPFVFAPMSSKQSSADGTEACPKKLATMIPVGMDDTFGIYMHCTIASLFV